MRRLFVRFVRVAVLVWSVCGVASLAHAADWFVAPAGAGGFHDGDGSRQRPFSDLWRALAVAAPGDVIRIAEGTYYGRHDRSAWVIDRPRLTIAGGYDATFASRDPWTRPTVLAFYRDFEGTNENSLLVGRENHAGVIIDGIVIDGAGRNRYNPKPPHELRGSMTLAGPLAVFASPDVVIRNSVFLNSSTGGVELRGEGSRFENNIVANHQGQPMLNLPQAGGPAIRRPIVVRQNTFAFAHDESDPPLGKGGEKGVAIRVASAAQIERNVFVACGNAALNVYARPADVSIDENVFSLSPRAHVAARLDGREYVLGARNLEELEDLGFKSTKQNRTLDVELTGLPVEWIDGVSRQIFLSYATPPKEGLLALRARYKLGEPAPAAGDDRGPASPLLAPAAAAGLRVNGESGARPMSTSADFGSAAPAAAAPQAQYTRIAWADLIGGDPSLDGRPVEVVVAMGQERNGFLRAGISADTHIGFDVYGTGVLEQINMYAPRHGPVHRQFQESAKSANAREAEDWYLLRGIARATGRRPALTIEAHAIVSADAPQKPVPARPAGREWFVRAGATGGDGSRESPFRDPFQALDKAGPGDTIRVAGGEYFGRLRSGNWKVPVRHLTLVGGYSTDFSTRDPWTNATRLGLPSDADRQARAAHTGRFLECADICEGLVVDGFVIDAATLNTYFDEAAGGGLDVRGTPISTMVEVRGADIVIRNSVFANASGVGVSIGSISGTFENNVVVGTSGTGVRISAMGPGPWLIRRNTFLFTVEPTKRAGTGGTGSGAHLVLTGRAAARIEENVFGFADGCAIRATTPGAKLSIDRNAFAVNLYCHLTDSNYVWLFDAVWDRRLADAGLASSRGNQRTLPGGMSFDVAYVDRVLPRLFELNSRYTRDDWVAIASGVGSSRTPPAAADKPAEPPKPEKPREPTLEDLMRELESFKKDTAKPAAGPPKGPPYAPAYSWQSALRLVAASESAPAGARRVTSK